MGSTPPDETITPSEMLASLQESGYLLEGRVGRALEASGFAIEVNAFWADPRDQTKSIELDVVGRISEVLNADNGSSVGAEMLIECKNNSQPVVFFIKSQRVGIHNMNRCRYDGFPVSSADPETKQHVALHSLLQMNKWHHYSNTPEIATQFCGFSRDTGLENQQKQKNKPVARPDWRWKVEPLEHYSRAFASLAVAAACAGIGRFDARRPNIELVFYYPVVVFQGPIYGARIRGNEVTLHSTRHIQLHHATSFGGDIVEAQIDIVSEDGLPDLVSTVRSELSKITEGIKNIEPRLLNSAADQKEVRARRAAGAALSARMRGNDFQ